VLEWNPTDPFLLESTVITLADWYHYPSKVAPLVPYVIICSRSSDARQSMKCVQFHPDQRKRSLSWGTYQRFPCCGERSTRQTVSFAHISSNSGSGPHASHYDSYRFRLVSISCDPSFNFSIDSHEMLAIEADGHNVQPVRIDSLHIYAGEEG
jgi:Multicopper oxidase